MIKNERIDGIDGWRAISVLLIIAAHMIGNSSIGSDSALAKTIHFGYGALGVRVFFVISGFVICRGLIQEYANNNRVSLGAFYIRRIFRIIPPLAFFAACISLLALSGIVDSHAVRTARGLLFVCDFGAIDCGGVLGQHLWSLAVEEQFYLIFPLLFILSARSARFFLAVSLAISSAALLLAVLKFPGAAGFLNSFTFIGVGVAAAFYEQRIAGLTAKTHPVFIALAIIAVMTITVLPAGRVNTVLLSFVTPGLIAFILLATTLAPSSGPNILTTRPVVMLGRISYGVYLWQQLATYPFAGAGYLFYTVSIFLCVLFSLCSYRYFEKPLINFSRRLSVQLKNGQPLMRRPAAEQSP